jgi:hypothetical protein
MPRQGAAGPVGVRHRQRADQDPDGDADRRLDDQPGLPERQDAQCPAGGLVKQPGPQARPCRDVQQQQRLLQPGQLNRQGQQSGQGDQGGPQPWPAA